MISEPRILAQTALLEGIFKTDGEHGPASHLSGFSSLSKSLSYRVTILAQPVLTHWGNDLDEIAVEDFLFTGPHGPPMTFRLDDDTVRTAYGLLAQDETGPILTAIGLPWAGFG